MNKVFSVSLVKNEEDIIESFVRYHLNLFDGMVILDNKSSDNTVNILERLIDEGLPLFVHHDTSIDFLQSEKTTKLAYEAFLVHDPDIIFPLDADEFLIAANGRDHPRDIISGLDPQKLIYMGMRQYIPTESDRREELFVPKRMIHMNDQSSYYKVAVTKEVAFRFWPVIAAGNHDVILQPEEMPMLEKEISNDLMLAHYPVRSLEQAKSKYVIGWLAHLTRYNLEPGQGFHRDYAYHAIKNKPNITLNEFISSAPHIADPIDTSFCQSLEIKFTEANEFNLQLNLLEFGETLAIELSELKKQIP